VGDCLLLSQAVECGCVPQLLGLLQGNTAEIAAAAASALMMLTLAKEGKVALHQVRLSDRSSSSNQLVEHVPMGLLAAGAQLAASAGD
jgi:hypothetical protein